MRDLDFLYNHFEKVKRFYFNCYIPFLLYESKLSRAIKNKDSKPYFGIIIYNKLMKIIEKSDDAINKYSGNSILYYYGPSKPSDHEVEYFEKFADWHFYNKMVNESLTIKIIPYDTQEISKDDLFSMKS